MKKFLLPAAVIAMLFFSCKKDHSNSAVNPSVKKYKVAFNVANLKMQLGSFALRTGGRNLASSDTLTQLNTYFDILYCYIYQGPTFDTHTIVQDSTMNNMGAIVDSLPNGTYQIAIVAGKKGLKTEGTDRVWDGDFYYVGQKWQDLFFYSGFLTVNNSDVNETIVMKRRVGKLELHIEDAIPASADSLSLTINPEAFSRNLSNGATFGGIGGPVTYSVLIPASARGNTGFTMDRIIGNTGWQFNATITCKNASNQVIATKTVNDITVDENARTILTGQLFNGIGTTGNTSFTVKADTAWNGTPQHVTVGP